MLGFIDVNAQIDEVEQRRRRVAARTRTIVQTKIKVIKVPEDKYQKISGVVITTVQPNAEIELESINLKKKTKWTKKSKILPKIENFIKNLSKMVFLFKFLLKKFA